MIAIPKYRWIDPLGFELACSPSFADAMSKQLAARALVEHDIDLERGFALAPYDFEPKIQVTDDQISVIEVDLIGPDAYAEFATIAWYNTAGNNTLVAPSDPVDGREDVDLRFWWHVFPEREDLERYRSCPPLVETSARVVWNVVCWPEVELRLAVESPPSSEWIETATAIMRDAVEQWNAQEGAGVIYDWAPPERIPSGEYLIFVDFGSAPMAALGTLLDRLSTLSDPPLRHITVCATGMPRD